MKSLYRNLELVFEKIANIGFRVFRNSLVFMLAIAVIIYWMIDRDWQHANKTDIIRDIILSVTFLSFFLIQRTFSHFSDALHLKINELVAAHDKAGNHFIGAEEKSDEELKELGREHDKIKEDQQNPDLK